MKILASTQIQFGGFILNSEDDAAIVQHLTRLIAHAADAMACISEICHLLFILLPMAIEISHKVLSILIWLEKAPILILDWCEVIYIESAALWREVGFLFTGKLQPAYRM